MLQGRVWGFFCFFFLQYGAIPCSQLDENAADIYINTLWLVVKADKVAKKPLTSQQLLLQTHLLHVAARMRLRSLPNLPQGK